MSSKSNIVLGSWWKRSAITEGSKDCLIVPSTINEGGMPSKHPTLRISRSNNTKTKLLTQPPATHHPTPVPSPYIQNPTNPPSYTPQPAACLHHDVLPRTSPPIIRPHSPSRLHSVAAQKRAVHCIGLRRCFFVCDSPVRPHHTLSRRQHRLKAEEELDYSFVLRL
jgi:hypothetical protein